MRENRGAEERECVNETWLVPFEFCVHVVRDSERVAYVICFSRPESRERVSEKETSISYFLLRL